MSKEVVTSYLQYANVLTEIDKGNNPIYLSKYTNLMNRKWLTKYLKKHGIEIL